MSSKPEEEHSFLLESFAEFEALARRALHEDLKSGSYMPLNNPQLCNELCESDNKTLSGCCNDKAQCSCGTLSGHYVCLCLPGYYGSGLIGEECLPCPRETYHDGLTPGDETICRPCPDNNQDTIKFPATSKKDCKCSEGFIPFGDKCQVITCPHVTPPTNGYFVKKSCSNVLHAACGVRCNIGFDLTGSSVRLCQKNGTWSGVAPRCVAKNCDKLKPVSNAEIICTNEDEDFEVVIKYDENGNKTKQLIKRLQANEEDSRKLIKAPIFDPLITPEVELNFTIDTECKFSCLEGFSLVGSKARSCLPVMRWGGLQTTCKAITCSSLPALKNGVISPKNCTARGIKHGYETACQISCEKGYQLKGPREKNCTGKYGTWTGKNSPSKCIDVEPPQFKCLENVTITTDSGMSFATVNLSLPEATDNSQVVPTIWFKPAFDENFPLKLNIGITEIQVVAMDGSNNTNSCKFYIDVKDTESPIFQNCDTSYTFFLSTPNSNAPNFIWDEPIVTDNSDGLIEVEKSHSSKLMMGLTSIIYTALDSSKNKAQCTVNVTVLENPCADIPESNNAEWNCSLEENITTCLISCPLGQRFIFPQNSEDTNLTMTCIYEGERAIWSSDFTKDSDMFPECSPSETPTEASEVQEIALEGDAKLCDSLEQLLLEISNEIYVILGGDGAHTEVTARCEDVAESKIEEATNIIQKRKKRNARRRKIYIDVSLTGTASNYPSTKELINHLNTSGQKIQNQYSKQKFLKVNGEKIKISAVEVIKAASIVCENGSVPRGDFCVKCPKGTYYNSTSTTCDACPIGEYQDLEGQAQCIKCPEGFSTKRPHSRFLKNCKRICLPGSYGRKLHKNNIAIHPCLPCDIGYYQPSQGQFSCVKCPNINSTTLKKGSIFETDCMDIELKNPCLKFPCRNNGSCFLENTFAACSCPEGFIGSFCEKSLDPCESSPCYNGLCIKKYQKEFNCICSAGYEGEYCQFEINECESSPCKNGGECVDILNGFVCNCATGFTGIDCSENINECDLLNPCQNNATCIDMIDGYDCSCDDNFFGSHCEQIFECDENEKCNGDLLKISSSDSCSATICPSNMACLSNKFGNVSKCICKKGFAGENCTEVIDTDVVLTFSKCTVTDYLFVNMPQKDLDAISFCVWLQTTDKFNYGTLLSYSTYDDDNAFTFTDYNGFVLYIQKKRVITDITANDGFWHFICVTWQSKGGNWHIYLDGAERASGSGLSDHSPIPGGGKLIIGQEQDRFGGGFNEVESFVGKMAYLEVWDRELVASEIELMNQDCGQFNGDLFNWLDFIENRHGNIQVTPSTFCKDCKSELSLFRGRILLETRENLTLAKYECDDGFFIKFDEHDGFENNTNKIWYRRCMKHGDWEPNPPKCSRIKCGFPGYFPHGSIIGSSYYYSDVLIYRCAAGYALQGNSTRICQADGNWSGQKPYCQGNLTTCKPLVAPRHGAMFIYFSREDSHDIHFPTIGDRVEFTCDEGFHLRGSEILTCTEEGIWDSEEPFCEEIKCPISEKIADWMIEPDENINEFYSVNDYVILQCPLIKLQRKIICGFNGKWNFSENICDVRCFEKPNIPDHGYLLEDGRIEVEYKTGEIILVGCNHGYQLLGDNFFNCSENGDWLQKRKSSCKPVECGPPLPIPNAESFQNQIYFYGDKIVYRCLPGYQKYGDVSIRCEAEARWSRIQGRCIRKSCGKPEIPEGATIKGNSYSFQDTIEVTCTSSSTPESLIKDFIVCQSDGTWSKLSRCKS